MSDKKKTFDCVEMKNKIQEQVYEDIKNLTPEEEMDYFKKSAETGPFSEKWKAIQERQARKSRKVS